MIATYCIDRLALAVLAFLLGCVVTLANIVRVSKHAVRLSYVAGELAGFRRGARGAK